MHQPGLDLTRRSLLQAAALGTLGSSFVLRDAHAQAAPGLKLTTGLRLANYGPLYVAQRSGLFEKQGLKLALDVGGSVNEPVAIALSGRGQFAATGTNIRTLITEIAITATAPQPDPANQASR